MKIARVTSVPLAFVHIKKIVKLMSKRPNVEVSLISSYDPKYEKLHEELQVNREIVTILREVDIVQDIKSLVQLFKLFRKNRYDIIHSSTPKAGLLVSLAGFFSVSKIRLHTFTGQRWATMKGLKRSFFKLLDKLIIRLNTRCYADSASQISFLISEGVAKEGQVHCLGSGSYGGFDLDKFNPELIGLYRSKIREELNIPQSDVVMIFVGRLCRDKGIVELFESFSELAVQYPNAHLILVGDFEEQLADLRVKIDNDPRIKYVGFQSNPESYLAASDFMVLPSYREGFGTVVLEASGVGIPTIGTRIPGLVDAIVDGQTGLLVTPCSKKELSDAISYLLSNREVRINLGQSAYIRAKTLFECSVMENLLYTEYKQLLSKTY